MRAIVHDPAVPGGLPMVDLPEPVPAHDQAVVAVEAVSLNFLDVAYRDGRLAPGAVPGVDAAGTVVAAAVDGSGPPVGARVAGFGPGTWAEAVALRTADLAVVPDDVDLAVAAALPGAGVTALRAVRALGSVLGRRVLVTGASGGVGRFAVQLAALAGARVVALVGSADRGRGLRELGADDVVTALYGITRVDGVLDNVGGPVLTAAFAALAPGGLALSIGQAGRQPSTFDFEAERQRGGGRRVEAFVFGTDLGADLGVLLDLVARGRLEPQIGWRGSWERIGEAAEALGARQVLGKAVLDVRREVRS
jgi:NADPH:quinone reductase